jgi:FtsP/CotA-like multicopper oxidase with cupredoxin domain
MPQKHQGPGGADEAVDREATEAVQTPVSRRGLLGAAVGTAAVGGVAVGVALTGPGPGSADATRPAGRVAGPVQADVLAAAAHHGAIREYWIQADSFQRNTVPNGHDGMMGTDYSADQTTYYAVGYRAYTPHWGKVLDGDDDIGPNAGIPGPNLRAEVGDTIVVHFKNNDSFYKFPHSMHPHGVEYDGLSDGAWLAKTPNTPGTAVKFGETYTYTWRAKPNSVGTWPYHDHSVPQDLAPFYPKKKDASASAGGMDMGGGNAVMEIGAELGLLGLLAITDDKTPKVDKEFFLFFHDLYSDDIPSIGQDLDLFNGYAFIDNTPTFRAKAGQKVRWRVAALGKEFHVFHLHGHRWWDGARWTDSQILGPSMAITVEYTEDNAGDWLYHCHVVDHMMGGMIGRYVVEK